MEAVEGKTTAVAPVPVPTPVATEVRQPTAAPALAAQHPPAPPSQPDTASEPKASVDAPSKSTPPFSPTSQTPVLEKEQEEFEGTVDVNNDLPTEKDLKKVDDLLVLDAQGQSRPFKDLYKAPHVAPRQLIIFIRHFFCGVSSHQPPKKHI